MKAWLKKQSVFYWILSLVLAVMFWLYVGITQDMDIDRTFNLIIPDFQGEEMLESERGIVVTDGMNITLDLVLRGKASDLALCTRENISIVVNLRTIKTAGEHSLLYSIYLPEEVRDRVQIKERSMESIPITTDEIKRETFTIKIDGGGIQLPEGYKLGEIEIEPAQVKVSGKSELLKLVKGAQIAPLQEGLDRTTSLIAEIELIFDDDAEVEAGELICDPQEVNVTLPVIMVKEVELTVDLIEGGGALEKHAEIEINPKTIQLSGDPQILGPIHSITLGNINLANVIIDGDVKSFPITIPNGADSNAGPTAEVTVRIIGLTTKKVYTEDIMIIGGEREGYTVRLVGPGLSVILRGPQSSIDQLTESDVLNVRVVVDLTDIDLARGQQDVDARVIVDDYPEVGALGSPKVTVEMSKNEP